MYKAKDSVYKIKTRDNLFKMVTKHCKGKTYYKRNILTLCNTSLSLERRLRDHYDPYDGMGCVVDCYELDKNVVCEVGKQRDVKNIYIHNMNVFDHPKQYWAIDPYTFVWLDFCNSYKDEFITKIVELVSKIKWERKAVLTITLNKKRGTAEDNLLYGKFYKNYKDVGFAQHIRQFLPPVVKITRMQYTCRDICTQGATMNVFSFFIDKTKKK